MRRTRQTAYQRLLRDPRWQRRRLQIFERDGWTCRECGDETSELQVHHKEYIAGAAPWEVPPRTLVTLCVTCHRKLRKKPARPPKVRGVTRARVRTEKGRHNA